MAEVIRALAGKERTRYMLFDEMPDRGRNEAYEAAGEYLMMACSIDGPITEPGYLLIELSGRERVCFPHGESVVVDAMHTPADS
jgi:hypothetical protein